MKMRLFRTLTISIIISLALHLSGAWLLTLAEPSLTNLTSARKETAFVELVDSTDKSQSPVLDPRQNEPKRTIVRQAEVPPELLTNKERKARFLSERDQTVLEEQRARDSGLTANRDGKGTSEETEHPTVPKRQLALSPKSALSKVPKELTDPQKPGRAEKLPHEQSGDIAVGGLTRRKNPNSPSGEGESKPLLLPNLPQSSSAASTVGEQLPSDIKFGNFTALNTDRYLYYSFYARVEELVRHRWVKYVRAVLYSYQNSAPRISGQESWTTQIEIVLDKDGNFKRGVLHNSSGLQGLDAAPVQAFREAKQIPNPPAEMVKADGTIHLMYEFNVNFVPQYAAGG
jgi:TonB family protein